ncbi:hypothetical protein HYH02_007989 [Chlamydomonas schloesseri]|uniref:Protein kinase domain-containing protein n=1 Tax=Chlamydomonas schloesseri TaxID=2026947 RepID=A0A836B4R0_9CHLO|nr:hypothetical protein HYH02_007989 [Chlamydomonas schloesseri]|eukprot:KAG2447249.1 hypothetical protein HYH02_007989 [Chlamydomonas schloesseri]
MAAAEKAALGRACLRKAYDYDNSRAVDGGAEGSLYVVTRISTGTKAAVKVLERRALVQSITRQRNATSSVNTRDSGRRRAAPSFAIGANEDVDQYQARELAAISQLIARPHKNIVEFYDLDTQDPEYLMLFMEFVPGGSLRELINQAPDGMPASEAAELIKGILAGVAHLHSLGYLHRDLKPENVMLERGGPTGAAVTPKLVDFGMIGVIPGTGATRPPPQHYVVGTAMYLSPEVFSMRGFTGAADMWSVGVILYEMLVGKLPFNNGNHFALNQDFTTNDHQRYNASIEKLRRTEGCPPALAELCHAMLQLNPAARPKPADALAWLQQGNRPAAVPMPAMAQANVTEVIVIPPPERKPRGQQDIVLWDPQQQRAGVDDWPLDLYGRSGDTVVWDEDKDKKAKNAGDAALAGVAVGLGAALLGGVAAGPIAASRAVSEIPTRVAEVPAEQRAAVAREEQAAAANTGGYYGTMAGSVGGGALGVLGAAALGAVAAPVMVAGGVGLLAGAAVGGVTGRWAGWGTMCNKQAEAHAGARC